MVIVLPKRTVSWGFPFCTAVQVICAAKRTLPHKHTKPLHHIASEPTHALNRSRGLHAFPDEASYKELLCRFLLFLCPLYFATIAAQPLVFLIYPPGLQARCAAPNLKAVRHWKPDQCALDDHPIDYCLLQQLSSWIPFLGGTSNLWLSLPLRH